MCKDVRVAAVLVLTLLAAGCQHSVKIEEPKEGAHKDPVKQFTVRFHKEFKPNTFQAVLSGTTITHLFSPPPAPGGVSHASIFDPNFMDFHHDKNNQKLIVDGEFSTSTFNLFGIPTRFTRDSATFSPPPVRIFRGGGTAITYDANLTLKERQVISATAFVYDAPKERLVVKILGHPYVSLNDRPAGEPIEVVIPPNDRRADFTVRGIVVGPEAFQIRALSTGYSSAIAGGYVQRAE